MKEVKFGTNMKRKCQFVCLYIQQISNEINNLPVSTSSNWVTELNPPTRIRRPFDCQRMALIPSRLSHNFAIGWPFLPEKCKSHTNREPSNPQDAARWESERKGHQRQRRAAFEWHFKSRKTSSFAIWQTKHLEYVCLWETNLFASTAIGEHVFLQTLDGASESAWRLSGDLRLGCRNVSLLCEVGTLTFSNKLSFEDQKSLFGTQHPETTKHSAFSFVFTFDEDRASPKKLLDLTIILSCEDSNTSWSSSSEFEDS